MNSPKVICLGEALVDRLGPIGGEIDFIDSSNDFLGGAPANVACGLAKLGVKSAFIGCLGNDQIGKRFCNLFNLRKVNISGLQINADFPSRIVLVSRDKLGERSFGGFLGSNDNNFSDQNLDLDLLKENLPSLFHKARWLVTGTIPLVGYKSIKSTNWIVDNAIKYGLQIAIDVNWRPTFWNSSFDPDSPPDKKTHSLILSFLEKANLIKLSREEAFFFFNSNDPLYISHSLYQKPNVIVTDGSKPIKWFIGSLKGETETFSPPNVVDTTGAGDSFLSGIIYKLISNQLELKSAEDVNLIIRFAAACGALVCGGSGAIDCQPSPLEVNNFLASCEDL